MPTPQKEAIVQEMAEKFSSASSIILADFSGVDVNTINQLRKNFREAKVEYRVVKNTLARLSLEKAGIEGLADLLTGVNGYVMSFDDPTTPIKVLEKMKKELAGRFPVKTAYFEGEVIPQEKVAELAKLPSKPELLGILLGMLQSPMSKFAATIQAPMQNLVGVLKALSDKQE